MKKRFALLLALPTLLASCVMNNGLCMCGESKDADSDGYCDTCGKPIEGAGVHSHIDSDKDNHCDICGIEISHDDPVNPCQNGHTDNDFDGKCDVCGANTSTPVHTHIDTNPHDNKCDVCGATMGVCSHVDLNSDYVCDICGEDLPRPTSEVTVYLVLSSVGLYKGAVGTTVPDKYLENTIVYTALPGTALPGKEDVTHLYQSATFESWLCYEDKGAPTIYTTVPSVNGLILYANFIANGSSPVDPIHHDDDDDDPSETETYYLKTAFADGNWSDANAKIMMYCFDNSGNSKFYNMNRDSDQQYSVEIPVNTYFACVFARMDQSVNITVQNWNGIWNQTENLNFETGKHTAQITSWTGGQAGNSSVIWVA